MISTLNASRPLLEMYLNVRLNASIWSNMVQHGPTWCNMVQHGATWCNSETEIQFHPTLVSKHMLWDWDWYYAEFTQRVFYARIFRLCYYYHKLCIVIVTIVKCCNTYMQYDWSKRTYFAYSTALIQIKIEPLQYKMKWCRFKKICNFLSFKDEVNRENNKRINKWIKFS